MESVVIIGLLVAILIATVALGLRGRRGAPSAEESQLVIRLDNLISAIQQVRADINKDVAAENRESRKEVSDTLNQFRESLDGFRKTLAEEQGQSRSESRISLENVTKSLSEKFEKLQTSNEQKLTQIREEVEKKLNETFAASHNTFKDVSEKLTQLTTTNESIMSFSKNLNELQSVLQAPKLRGEMGEIEMERMLRDCLSPDQFDLQHGIFGGNKVDAVIFNPQGKLPIDSKFPLEAWRKIRNAELSEADRKQAGRDFVKAVKKHIDDIATKYIRPPDTLDCAVMYVPAVGVYYELIETPEIMEHARKARIFPASPMTFWALLQVTVIGFRGLQISKDAKRISGLLEALKGDIERFKTSFRKAATQVRNADQNMTDANLELDNVDRKLTTIHSTQTTNGLPETIIFPPKENLLDS